MKTTLRESFDNLSTAAAKASFALLQIKTGLEFMKKKEEMILRACPNRRVVHLARHGKTKRVRLKNMQRAAREFEKKGEII
ncbi:MAG: hypothetical protein U0I48_01250 [Acutalibacteraceae bacterium]|nr:hypothetical protein [Acutalibacteraceae bacterium]